MAERLELDRSAVSRIEAGTRGVDSLELTRIAEACCRPVTWFLTPEEAPLDAVLLRSAVVQAADARHEVEWLAEFARDCQQLRELVPELELDPEQSGYRGSSISGLRR
ncbi:MAG: helix-turn-helix domain-containing protein [Chloroflexota bacterium]|nr:helix-turn-helix domain-containing protein [Chloroflexota bacterium]